MPAYHYKALDDHGSVQKGLLEGDSARQVRQQLRDKQWTPVEVTAVNDRQSQNKNRYKKPYPSNRLVMNPKINPDEIAPLINP